MPVTKNLLPQSQSSQQKLSPRPGFPSPRQAGGVQAKLTVPPQQIKHPTAPPAYRPQPIPKVLQTKASTTKQQVTQCQTNSAPAIPSHPQLPRRPETIQAKIFRPVNASLPQKPTPSCGAGNPPGTSLAGHLRHPSPLPPHNQRITAPTHARPPIVKNGLTQHANTQKPGVLQRQAANCVQPARLPASVPPPKIESRPGGIQSGMAYGSRNNLRPGPIRLGNPRNSFPRAIGTGAAIQRTTVGVGLLGKNVIQRSFTVMKAGTKSDEEKYDKKFLPPINQRQKNSLSERLKSLSAPRLKGLQMALSAKKLQGLGLNDIQGLLVLELINTWAGEDTEKTFDTWDAVVSEAAKQLGFTGGTSTSVTTTISSQKDKVLIEESQKYKDPEKAETQLVKFLSLLEPVCKTALTNPNFNLTFTMLGELLNTAVNIHGEKMGGVKASIFNNVEPGVITICKSEQALKSIVQASHPLAVLLNLSEVELLLNIMRRIIAGSVRTGKCNMMATSMQKMCGILPPLSVLCRQQRVSQKAWGSILRHFMKVFWEAEAKNQAKMCRELQAALSLLQVDNTLVLEDYETKYVSSSGKEKEGSIEYEFDLTFSCTGAPEWPQMFSLDLESEKEGTKNSWNQNAVIYYADRWAKKAKNFAKISNAEIFFMISSHSTMPKGFPASIRDYARQVFHIDLKIVTVTKVVGRALQRQPVNQLPVMIVNQPPVVNQRRLSFSSSQPNNTQVTRPRSKSLPDIRS